MQGPVVITKKFKVDLAHFVPTQILNCNPQKCNLLHGHSIVIETLFTGLLHEETDMVLDYTLLKDFKTFLDVFFDHKTILPGELLMMEIGLCGLLKLIKETDETLLKVVSNKENSPLAENWINTWSFETGKISGSRLEGEELENLVRSYIKEKLGVVSIGSFTILPTMSTTAERLSIFLTNVLERFVYKWIDEGEKIGKILQLGISFYETENSQATYVKVQI